MVKNLIACELAYINTNHPDFLSGSKVVAEVVNKRKQSPSIPVNDKKCDDQNLCIGNSNFAIEDDALSERELIETEIISNFSILVVLC